MESPLIQKHLPILFLVLLCLNLLPTTAALECYARNKVAASSSKYFNDTVNKLIGCGTDPTTCCFDSQYCEGDLLCHDKKTGALTRQYCSDPDWPEGGCSQVCPQFEGAGVALTLCDKTGTKFCCGPSDDCCKTGNYTHIDKRTGKIIAIGTSKIATSTTATPTDSTSTAAAASKTTAITDASSSAMTNASSGDSGGMSEQTKLGVGLGIGLGVPFLGAIAAALFFWRQSLLSQAQAQAQANGRGYASSPDEMAKVAGTTGREAELGDNPPNKPVYQLEADTNTRFELGGDRRVLELQ